MNKYLIFQNVSGKYLSVSEFAGGRKTNNIFILEGRARVIWRKLESPFSEIVD